MSRPLIGISTYLEESATWRGWTLPAALLPAGYPGSVQAAGGLAVLLPPDAPQVAAATVARLDGLIVAGGEDIDPRRYGAEPHPRTGAASPRRDDWELALIEGALASGTPLLGICRGMQLLNVALGGTLVQHLPEVVGHLGHAETPGIFGRHKVQPVRGTLLAATLPEPVEVSTFHHQAVDRLGTALRAGAHADDGTVEAIELPGDAFALGVQWHPEMGDDLRLVQTLIAAAR